MKENDLPVLVRKESSRSAGLPGKSFSYKFWVLFAVLLLAFWSMFTGSVTLKWSAGNLSRFSDDFSSPNYDDLDILEVEEREKVVRLMWDVYTQSRNGRVVPRFWQEAFEAAYEDLVSDVPGLRDAAFLEIAKISLFSITLDPLPVKSAVSDSNKS
ncbi:hypothetical protein L484_021185 [Morus notabilis]|uniref:Uncharacterized protein n=1 Tax=Morus notabilis TaxID=981085 RepID=W9S0Z1_9ROSA|nr:uncharacterized protein LOC112094799 [Morus notabilis]EXC07278.1 hypothetical protein L484_021185 [Morus notabilis]